MKNWLQERRGSLSAVTLIITSPAFQLPPVYWPAPLLLIVAVICFVFRCNLKQTTYWLVSAGLVPICMVAAYLSIASAFSSKDLTRLIREPLPEIQPPPTKTKTIIALQDQSPH